MGKVNKVDIESVRKLMKLCKSKNISLPTIDTLMCDQLPKRTIKLCGHKRKNSLGRGWKDI